MSSPIELSYDEARELLLNYSNKLSSIKLDFVGHFSYSECENKFIRLNLNVTAERPMFLIEWNDFNKTIIIKSYAPNANFNICDKVDIKFVSKTDIKLYVEEIIQSVLDALVDANKLIMKEFVRIDPKWSTYEKSR